MRLLLLCCLIPAAGCRDDGGGQSDSRNIALRAKAAGSNLLLITLDTTRADRLGCYGHTGGLTPMLDSLARSGVRCDQAFCQVPITLPSHTVLLTGAYPAETGVRVNARQSLGTELPTLAEAFQERGYRTAAFLASFVLGSRYGLGRGFETYTDAMAPERGERWRFQIPGDLVCDRALAWLDQVADQPFMCWVHFYDPHEPYSPPAGYRREGRHPYDGEVAFMDAQVGRLIDWLRARNLTSKTMIVALADHGEALGEHGYKWHSLLLYDSITRVPLIFSLPGRLPENAVCPGAVGIVDVMPTVLDLMGWEIPPQVTGLSFAAALGGGPALDRACYSETDYPYTSFGWSKLRSLVDDHWKYIRAPMKELYDLSSDRGELRNLTDARPDVVQNLEQKLAALEASMRQGKSAPVAVDEGIMTALASLGYVDAGAPAPAEGGNLKNPVDMADITHDYRWAEAMVGSPQSQQAIELLEAALKRSPESYALIELLGEAYAAVGRLEDAQRLLMHALSIYPRSAHAHTELAATLARRRRFKQAIESCRTALELEPNRRRALAILEAATADLEKQRNLIASYRTELQADLTSVERRVRLANVLVESGQTQAAVQTLRQGLSTHPREPRLVVPLAWLLATAWQSDVRDGTEAVSLARLVCGSEGKHSAHCLDALAAAHAEAGQFYDAVGTARRAAEVADAAGDPTHASAIRRRLVLYESGQPYRQLP